MGNKPSSDQQPDTATRPKPSTVPVVERERAISDPKNVAARQPPPTQPMSIGGENPAPSAEPTRAWDDDAEADTINAKSNIAMLSQSAPVYSNRFPRPMPGRPILKPALPVPIDAIPDIALPPPSLPEKHAIPFSVGRGEMAAPISQSVPLSRSLLQNPFSLPPNLQALEQQAQKQEQLQTRARKGSILDMMATGDLRTAEGETDNQDHNSDDDLPFR